MTQDEALLAAAAAFRDDDPDPETRAQTEQLLERAARGAAGAPEELAARFGAELQFGTAGLRGLLGAGTNRINRRTVARTTAALCAYLADQIPDARRRGLCLGYDGRHQSPALAAEVAEIAWGADFVVHGFAGVVPTPLLAYAVLETAAVGGVMITASHNPAAYNGYKIYLWNGAQLVSPHERGIQERLARLGPALGLPRVSRAEAQARGLLRNVDALAERYVQALAARVGRPATALPLRVAYSAMHGVGGALAARVFERLGVRELHCVPEQAEPDADFPSLPFPNPEEPGALDHLLRLGERVGAALALAHDPDADRLALAARGPSGALAALSGNELGLLLADHLLERAPRDGKNLLVTTIVSTPVLERVAAAHGARCERTLTGFKWIVSRALELERSQGLRLVLGFEEALGYCIGGGVRDKDGIAAAAHALHMAEQHAAGLGSLHAALEALYRRHGFCASAQLSIAAGVPEIALGMRRLRSTPPAELDGLRVLQFRDLAAPQPGAALPSSDVLVFELAGAHRITLRPSGTEPKLKLYLDVWAELGSERPLAEARAAADALVLQLSAAVRERLGL